ncbi:Properdin Complement factor P [Triplophysa tibetana]|uniref:Properdin Complement factor P n=1 Tax=Triplophysa tibetana TaxID=1572043 RepID=A0A5A9NZ94_9TELE|nr:Properdin Complement factor P [Triplophysa tibetana]
MNLLCWVMMVLGIYVQQSVSQMAQCFTEFSRSNGTCGDLLGEVEIQDCCINPDYGYVEADGVCKSCGRAEWSEWAPWSKCTVSCKDGVRQRKRMCYGIGTCLDPKNLGTIQTEPCMEQDCCPVEGGWSEWGNWQQCSVSCEIGIKKRQRTCSNPLPQCGATCEGEAEETASCNTEVVCPTHGGWSSWGNWGPCQGTCANEGHEPPMEFRKRTCTNPPPSSVPRGRDCDGDDEDSQSCTGLPFCSINGNWGPWSEPTPCTVTCGVGRESKRRTCDSPEPKHGGKYCEGDAIKTDSCTVPTSCPINGVWTEWSSWESCKKRSGRPITCRRTDGIRKRLRDCVGTKFGGKICDGEIVDHGDCYDFNGCELNAILSEWSQWSYCKPDCGSKSNRIRERVCTADISAYSIQDISVFEGTPKINCEDLKNETETSECKNLPEC